MESLLVSPLRLIFDCAYSTGRWRERRRVHSFSAQADFEQENAGFPSNIWSHGCGCGLNSEILSSCLCVQDLCAAQLYGALKLQNKSILSLYALKVFSDLTFQENRSSFNNVCTLKLLPIPLPQQQGAGSVLIVWNKDVRCCRLS